MDFHSLCQKIDVDNIRAKFPPLPAMPTLPHIKLPKSMPKIKSRKIFRSSHENINRNDSEKYGKQQQMQTLGSQSQLAYPPMPPASFIKQTPTRISTISSLVHQDHADGSTYRSAGSIDDDFPLPRRFSCSGGDLQVTSPLRSATLSNEAAIATNTQGRLSFTEKLHRSYKDLSEFRLKHIFAKKTVVRKDSIRVQHYVERYEEDLVREAKEQERRDRAIAENYTFRFKQTQQNIDHSNSVTPDDSPRSEPTMSRRPIGRTVGELSGDESGMEATPPRRKPGIAATRFAKVRNPPLRQSSSEHETERDEEKFKFPDAIPSSLWSTKINRANVSADYSDNENESEPKPPTTKSKFGYKERIRRLKSYVSTDKDTDATAVTAETGNEAMNKGSMKMLSKLKNIGKRNETAETETKPSSKRKVENSPQSTDEEQSPQTKSKGSPTAKTFDAIKQNIKRFHQSMKTRQQSTNEESGNEATTTKTEENKNPTKTESLTTRLRRFRSRDVSTVDLEDEDEASKKETTTTQSPIRQAITNKLETWKKSFRRKPDEKEEAQTSGGETSPEKEKPTKQKRTDTLIKRIKHIRARKNPDSKDEIEAENANTDTEATEETQTKTSKFTEARQRTLKKVNEKMQQLKFFQKSQEPTETKRKTTKESRYYSEEEDWDETSEHEQQQLQSPQHETKKSPNIPPAITRRDFSAHNEHYTEQENPKPLPNVHGTFNIPTARAVWTSKSPALSESLESDTDVSEFPRVLLHQDNSDSFESTLIIAVTRSPSTRASTSPRIKEITNEKELQEFMEQPKKPQKTEKPKQAEWIPNKNIIAGFLETTPPGCRKKSLDLGAPPIKHARRQSRDSNSNSNSDSETWIPDSKRKESNSSSQAGLISIEERNEAWKVKTETKVEHTTLYKSKSIDIFEKNILKGGALTAFEDFDEELRNEPVLKIATPQSADSYERDSSEDTADDDNSSRITKISVNRFRESSAETVGVIIKEIPKEIIPEKTLQQYANTNSRESLIANFDENEENENSQIDEDNDDDDNRPPSAAPSPPPKMSPPPPPLPLRQTSMRSTIKNNTPKEVLEPMIPPPLPKSKPPLPPVVKRKMAAAPPAPRIPERTASMPRAPKPLVKTSSLRLVFSEQVKPADIGKVNKLISRFEPTEHQTTQRPRVVPRRIQQDDSEEYSDDEEDLATMADKLKERYANIKIERDTTPTPTNTPKISTPEVIESPKILSNRLKNDDDTPIRIKRDIMAPIVVTTTDEDNNIQVLTQHVVEVRSTLDLVSDANSNYSHSNSEYGSPLEYPSSLRSSMETIPILEKKDTNANQRVHNVDRRSRRSMPREDDNYYSFDSDEENSYYSISSTGSNRYVVEL